MITTDFDGLIQTACLRWLSAWDWRWWKAQLYCESALNPSAVSPAGAVGIAQLMPDTAVDLARQLGWIGADPFDPAFAIHAGAKYMCQMRGIWWSERSEDDRRRLAQGCYNAGAGNILAAQRMALRNNAPAITWADISAYLHNVTGAHATETIAYVERIQATYVRLTTPDPACA